MLVDDMEYNAVVDKGYGFGMCQMSRCVVVVVL